MHVNYYLGKHVDGRCLSHFWNIISRIIILLILACCRVVWITLLLQKNGKGSVENWGRRWLLFVWCQADFRFILKEVYRVNFCWVNFFTIMIKRETSVPCQYLDSYNGERCDNIAPHPSIHRFYGTTARGAALLSEYCTYINRCWNKISNSLF
jgi:hypothetical protein